jgi:D-amino-acid oxidase
MNTEVPSQESDPLARNLDRRSFLRTAAAAGLGAAFAGANLRPGLVLGQKPVRTLAPVRVSRDRIIREIVGLRPYRAEGYVVEAQRIGNKTIIHNYGHGGAGITLSWGTASQAVDLVQDVPRPLPASRRAPASMRFAVIGCGVNGLSTAITLQRRYQNGPGTVTIYAKDLPPQTTSNIAAGYWSPVSLFEHDAVSPKFMEQFRAAARISNRAFQILVGSPEYGVRWLDIFIHHQSDASLEWELPGGNDLYPQQIIYRSPASHFSVPIVRQHSSMIIETPVYLRALLRDFYSAGGRIVVKEFRSREEILRLAEPVIFNCSGLGARELFNDQKLVPARGQLEVLLPQPEIDYGYIGAGHMFPRSDGIFLGGTFDVNDWSLAVNPQHSKNILDTHQGIMRGLKPSA